MLFDPHEHEREPYPRLHRHPERHDLTGGGHGDAYPQPAGGVDTARRGGRRRPVRVVRYVRLD
jgi:hypothetical protein